MRVCVRVCVLGEEGRYNHNPKEDETFTASLPLFFVPCLAWLEEREVKLLEAGGEILSEVCTEGENQLLS